MNYFWKTTSCAKNKLSLRPAHNFWEIAMYPGLTPGALTCKFYANLIWVLRWIFSLGQFSHQHPHASPLLNVEVLKRGFGELSSRNGARINSEEAVRNLNRLRNFRTEVSAFRFCDVAFYRLHILCFFLFSRTNLLTIVDRLVKKTETREEVSVPKKKVCRGRLDFGDRARRKLENRVRDRNLKNRGRFATRFPLSSRFFVFKNLRIQIFAEIFLSVSL